MFAGAIAVQTGISDIAPVSRDAGECADFFKRAGRWKEQDPVPGDFAFHTLRGTPCAGDGEGELRVGLVDEVTDDTAILIEGDVAGQVAYVRLPLRSERAKGYGTPCYRTGTACTLQDRLEVLRSMAIPDPPALSRVDYRRRYTVACKAGLHIRTGAGNGRPLLGTLRNGTQVCCFGRYSLTPAGDPWLFVSVAGTFRPVLKGFVDLQFLR